MSLNQEASPGMPGAGYHDTNDRDIAVKQGDGVRGNEAARDENPEFDS